MGDFTFFSPKGVSVIDYILVSNDLIPRISDFEIGFRADSDHLPVLLSILRPSSTVVHRDHPQNSFLRPKWLSKTASAFEQWSRLPEIEHLRQTIQLTNSPETVVLALCDLSSSVRDAQF